MNFSLFNYFKIEHIVSRIIYFSFGEFIDSKIIFCNNFFCLLNKKMRKRITKSKYSSSRGKVMLWAFSWWFRERIPCIAFIFWFYILSRALICYIIWSRANRFLFFVFVWNNSSKTWRDNIPALVEKYWYLETTYLPYSLISTPKG